MQLSAKQIRRYLYLILTLSFFAGLWAGQAAPKKYEPTHEQYLELKVKQQDAIIAQMQFNQAQQSLQQSYVALEAAANAVKKANGWPAEVQFNQQTLTFAPQPQPVAPPSTPEKKP